MIKLKLRSLEWALIQYDCIFIKGGNLGTKIDKHRKKAMLSR
jgi:hypothetical protein